MFTKGGRGLECKETGSIDMFVHPLSAIVAIYP